MKNALFALEDETVQLEVEQATDLLSEIENDQAPTANQVQDMLDKSEILDEVTQALGDNLESTGVDLVALEGICEYLSSAGQIDCHAARFADIAIEDIVGKHHLKSDRLCFGLESNSPVQASVAVEGVKEKIDELHAALKSKLMELSKHIGIVMNSFNKNLFSLKERLKALEDAQSKMTLDTAKYPAIKPESWCTYLCYTDSGFDVGLANIGKDVNTLLTDYTAMCDSNAKKYVGWFKDNYIFKSDENPFKTLKAAKSDFVLKGMDEFNRSVGMRAPKNTNMFYRSKELPGGEALYAQVQTTDKVGRAAIFMIGDVGYMVKKHDPTSYKLLNAKVSAIAALGTFAWAGATMSLPGAIVATALNAYLHSQRVKGTGREVSIPKDYMFQTLTKSQIKQSIESIKHAISALEKYNAIVLQKPWKTREIDKALDAQLDQVKVYNGANVRNMRSYSLALLSLMAEQAKGVHTHSFKVLDAMISFTEKSIRQYS